MTTQASCTKPKKFSAWHSYRQRRRQRPMNGRRRSRAERRVRRRRDFTFSLPFLYQNSWCRGRGPSSPGKLYLFFTFSIPKLSLDGVPCTLTPSSRGRAHAGISQPNRWIMVDSWDSGHARNTSTCFSAYGLADKSFANTRESWWYRPEHARKNSLRKALDASGARTREHSDALAS